MKSRLIHPLAIDHYISSILLSFAWTYLFYPHFLKMINQTKPEYSLHHVLFSVPCPRWSMCTVSSGKCHIPCSNTYTAWVLWCFCDDVNNAWISIITSPCLHFHWPAIASDLKRPLRAKMPPSNSRYFYISSKIIHCPWHECNYHQV